VDPQSAQPKGKRVYEPFSITKELDKASPKILQVLSTGETLTKVLFEYFRINAQGKEEKYFTIELNNAIVVGVRKWVPNCLDPDFKTYGHMETVSFTYEKSIWTAVVDGKEAQDSWKGN
jgi:type VI secretion system secreted protein Hcp